jgi:hypothetical protein
LLRIAIVTIIIEQANLISEITECFHGHPFCDFFSHIIVAAPLSITVVSALHMLSTAIKLFQIFELHQLLYIECANKTEMPVVDQHTSLASAELVL